MIRSRWPTTSAKESGFALLLVLWTVVLLALIGTQLTAAGRGETRLAASLRDAAVTEAAADAGVEEAIYHAIDTSPAHWPADAVGHLIQLPAATVTVEIRNEAGKINLNVAPPELLAALIQAAGLDTTHAASLSRAIADWRFHDVQLQGGARTDAYRAAGRSLGPPGAPFQTLEELGLVLGMTPGLLDRLTPYLTLFHEGAPNAQAASSVVRQALSMSTGNAPLDPAPAEESVIGVTARATGQNGHQFTRDCIVRIGQSRGGGLYQILTWGQG
jgi:general secretion pathway protein K